MYSHEWQNVKKPSVVYGFSCGEHDSDWDFADQPSRGSYAFASAESPIQLRNNSGGMDEDDAPKAEVWYPFQNQNQNQQPQQQQAAVAAADCEMSDDHSSGDDMDVEMDVQQEQQIQPAAVQGKRKRGAADMENASFEAHAYYQQQQMLENAKRLRVGA